MAEAPATPAPAAAPAAPAGDKAAEKPADAKPAIDPSEAGRTLRARRDAHMAALRDKAKGKEAAAAEGKASSQTPSTLPGHSSSTSAEAAASTPGSASTEGEPDDDLAALMKEDRRLKTEAKTLETRAAAVKDVEEAAPVIRTAREQLAKGNLLGAAKTVFGEAAMKDLLWELLKENPEGAEGQPPDVRAVIKSELAEERKAEQAQREKDAETAKQTEAQRLDAVDKGVGQLGFAAAVAEIPTLKGIDTGTVEAFGKYVAAVGAYFTDHKAEFRAVDRNGVLPLQVVQKCEAMRVERLKSDPTARPPTPAEVLKALDDELLAAARELVGVQAPAAPAPRVQTYSSAFASNPGSPTPAEERPLTVEERRARHKQQLRERRTA